jgi:hypothetical protein
VKQDLAELPELSGQQLSSRMQSHADRVRRLITSHEQLMKEMRRVVLAQSSSRI